MRLLRLVLFTSAAAAFSGVPAYAGQNDVVKVYYPRTWTGGFQIGVRTFGHFGQSDTSNGPPGGYMLQASYHLWYQHLVEGHVALAIGLSNSNLLIGFGQKLNLIEFLDDPTGETDAKGIHRGVLAKSVRDFMLFLSLDLNHYNFADRVPAPNLPYDKSQWVFQPGAGAEWFLHLRGGFVRRCYIETSVSFARVSDNNYMIPYLGLGIELR